ncbi:maker497 [Drosophila busckii]|uniref:Maker497 n=1 Tax=Drosophila busckii TaxID=30019 RepID=A0A0M5J3Y5_DROBS|nr:maker497 [Drosophila busckii]
MNIQITYIFHFIAFAIKCFQCESLSSPKCGIHFEEESTFLVDCAGIGPPRYLQNFYPVRNATGCMKKTIESFNGQPQVLRSCYFGDTANIQNACQPDAALPYVKQLGCDVCTKDECNGSSALTPALTVGALLLLGVARVLA